MCAKTALSLHPLIANAAQHDIVIRVYDDAGSVIEEHEYKGDTKNSDSLPQFECCAAYNLTIDLDVDAVGAHSQCTRAEIVDVLAAIDPKV